MNKRQIILGGGTFQPIRNHLSLAAPAFGTTATALHELLPNSELYLTKMADRNSTLVSNEDVETQIDQCLADMCVDVIVLNVAFCDYKAQDINNIPNSFHAERLKTVNGGLSVELSPTKKIISKIKLLRPDIFLVGFKTTTNKTSEQQYSIGLNMLQAVSCNLVLANDTIARNNILIDTHKRICFETHNRQLALSELATLIRIRDLQNHFS